MSKLRDLLKKKAENELNERVGEVRHYASSLSSKFKLGITTDDLLRLAIGKRTSSVRKAAVAKMIAQAEEKMVAQMDTTPAERGRSLSDAAKPAEKEQKSGDTAF